MLNRHRHTNYAPALDDGDDRYLTALVNEAHDPQEFARITQMARRRLRARRAAEPARSEQPTRSRGARFTLGRALSFRL